MVLKINTCQWSYTRICRLLWYMYEGVCVILIHKAEEDSKPTKIILACKTHVPSFQSRTYLSCHTADEPIKLLQANVDVNGGYIHG